MYSITYCLREKNLDSDVYYNDVALFTEEILVEGDKFVGEIIEQYIQYLSGKNLSLSSSKEDKILEFLTLGVLWNVYSGDALGLKDLPCNILTCLSKLRQEGGYLKPGIDFLRGILGTLFLSPDLYDNTFTLEPSIEHMSQLLNWLDATGEFKYEVKRLRLWQDFVSCISPQQAVDIIAKSISLAVWFELKSEDVLGCYTANVDRFLNEIRPKHYWREDVIFCGRRRVEYHLNMVGAQILNKVYKEAFEKAKSKLLVLPACMRIFSDLRCRAKKIEGGYICGLCTSQCKVNQLTQLGKTHGFDVVLVSHESSLSNNSENMFLKKDVGVIGVACALNLISGGWMLEEKNIPAQCVLLDYCGCKRHWHPEGIPTEINVKQLIKLL